LDPETSWGIMEVLDKIHQNGTPVVMAPHDHEIVNTMRRRVVELHEGQVMRDEAAAGYQPDDATAQLQSRLRKTEMKQRGLRLSFRNRFLVFAEIFPWSSRLYW